MLSLMPWRKNAITKENGDVFSTFQREMNRMMEQFNGQGFDLADVERIPADWSPRVNVAETEKEVQITAELPGVEEKDVEVTVDNGALIIKGEKRAEKEEKNKNYHRVERSYGSFQRILLLSREVEEEKAEAAFKNGVLTVKLPKTFAAQQSAKKIPVKNG